MGDARARLLLSTAATIDRSHKHFLMEERFTMIPARDALQRLRDGNTRFAKSVQGSDVYLHTRRPELQLVQAPHAIIFGCSDARVPAEIIFDQGLGDLFVIRVAGNIVAASL